MLRTLAKATVCSLGIHDWNEDNRCRRCGEMGCVAGRHNWIETDRQVVVSPQTYPNDRLSDDWHNGWEVTTTTRLFYECRLCGEMTSVSRVEEGYAGRA
jgi:hypothetical protein